MAAGVVAGRRCSYGDAADRQRDRANKGLPRYASSPRFLVRARGARHQVAAEVVAGRRCSYGDAADRQRDRANGGLTLWVFLLWNFGGYPAAGDVRSHLALKVTLI